MLLVILFGSVGQTNILEISQPYCAISKNIATG